MLEINLGQVTFNTDVAGAIAALSPDTVPDGTFLNFERLAGNRAIFAHVLTFDGLHEYAVLAEHWIKRYPEDASAIKMIQGRATTSVLSQEQARMNAYAEMAKQENASEAIDYWWSQAITILCTTPLVIPIKVSQAAYATITGGYVAAAIVEVSKSAGKVVGGLIQAVAGAAEGYVGELTSRIPWWVWGLAGTIGVGVVGYFTMPFWMPLVKARAARKALGDTDRDTVQQIIAMVHRR